MRVVVCVHPWAGEGLSETDAGEALSEELAESVGVGGAVPSRRLFGGTLGSKKKLNSSDFDRNKQLTKNIQLGAINCNTRKYVRFALRVQWPVICLQMD